MAAIERDERSYGLSGKVTIYGLLIVFSLFFLVPLAWALLASFKSPAELQQYPQPLLPSEWRWMNWIEVWNVIPLARFFRNTAVITGLALFGQLLSCSLVAYGFARFRFPLRRLLFGVVMAILILPSISYLIPQYVIYTRLGWLDTFLPLVVPWWLAAGPGSAFSIFLLRQFYSNIPREIEEAALVERLEAAARQSTEPPAWVAHEVPDWILPKLEAAFGAAAAGEAEALLEALLPASGNSVRIGISGVPGVGKSTFIERFGLHLVEQGHQVAVLAVDPSSKVSGGSILGDKTRMEELSRHPQAFIRPSPTGGTLGGVARRTREAMLVCEAAGFDVVIVETVGVGQSETAVAEMVDIFLLLLLPGGGDELQGIKKGIVELADAVIVNKADGDLVPAAERAVAEYYGALGLLRAPNPDWRPPVLKCSALLGQGIEEVWETVQTHREVMEASGARAAKRAAQAGAWMWTEISDGLLRRFKAHPEVARELQGLEREVRAGKTTPTAAATLRPRTRIRCKHPTICAWAGGCSPTSCASRESTPSSACRARAISACSTASTTTATPSA